MPIRRGRKPLSLLHCNTLCLIVLLNVVKLELEQLETFDKRISENVGYNTIHDTTKSPGRTIMYKSVWNNGTRNTEGL